MNQLSPPPPNYILFELKKSIKLVILSGNYNFGGNIDMTEMVKYS